SLLPSGDHTGVLPRSNVTRVRAPVGRSRSQMLAPASIPPFGSLVRSFRPSADSATPSKAAASPIDPRGDPLRSNQVGIVRSRLPAVLVASTPFCEAETATAPAATVRAGPLTFA